MEEKEIAEMNLKELLVNYGAINPDWRIKITDFELFNYASDWAWLHVQTFRPRGRKPVQEWIFKMNVPRGLVRMSEATWINF